MKKRIAIITNAQEESGVGSRAYQILSHMPETADFSFEKVVINGTANTLSVNNTIVATAKRLPSILGAKSISWVRLAKYIPHYDGYDITNQTLSSIAVKKNPSIITVHDIIELTNPQHATAALLHAFLLRGIPRATHIVAISEYVKNEILRHYSLPEDRITVIYNGVGDAFKPTDENAPSASNKELIATLRLPSDAPVVLSVGSDHPRKNLHATLQVIATLKKRYPNIVLIKIGDPGLLSGRKETLRIIDELGLQQNVRILDHVSVQTLVNAYQVSDALLMPSLQEGFGLPVVEAMASGCPVICSNATSLPEIVGDAGIMHDPNGIQAFAESVSELFESKGIKESFIARGIKRAKMFSWDTAAQHMLGVYKKYLLFDTAQSKSADL